jgi:hypothetical protein
VTLDDLVSATGSGGCLLAAAARAGDRLVQSGSAGVASASIASGLSEAPCRPRQSVPPPGPLPNSVTVRISGGELDLGWTGVAHHVRVLEGAHFTADMRCNGASGECYLLGGTPGELFGAPVPIVTESVRMCIVPQLIGEITGRIDPARGSLTATLPLRLEAVGTTNLGEPLACPVCATAAANPRLGDTGTCIGGVADGVFCIVEGIGDATLGAAAATSSNCPPDRFAPRLIAPIVNLELTTGTAALPTPDERPTCSAVGLIDHPCPCTGQRMPNQCDDLDCSLDQQGEYVCTNDPVDFFCDNHPFRSCRVDDDCGGGTCVLHRRGCFPESIVRGGTADPTHPTLAATFCFPATKNRDIDNTYVGLPGPAALVMQAELTVVH